MAEFFSKLIPMLIIGAIVFLIVVIGVIIFVSVPNEEKEEDSEES